MAIKVKLLQENRILANLRIEDHDFVAVVELSWNEEWNGTEQSRHFRIDGNKLFIESAPAPSIVFFGKTDFRRIVCARGK